MIHIDKPSLSVCAFGAGAAHAAVLALILPVMVTLPAPEDQAQGTVAIQVAVRSIPPASLVAAAAAAPDMLEGALAGEGDVDDTAWNELPPQELTGALPDIPEQAPLNEAPAVAAKPPVESADPVMNPDAALMERALESEAEMELRAVARVEATEPAAFSESEAVSVTVPLPLRKPAMRAVIRETVEVRPAPAPRRQVPARRTTTRAAPKPVFKGFFGGRPATPMKEFPFPAGR
ncbi:MAG TPA: hypothetical protein VMW05_03590 [Methyloceanibacter sp.]|nr:hypothetical protein [Methyloceanibacter sp.]